MKYKVEVWRHHGLVVKIEANDVENIKYLTEEEYEKISREDEISGAENDR